MIYVMLVKACGMMGAKKVVKLRNITRLDHLCYDIENLQVGSGATRKSLAHKDISHVL